MFGQRLTSWRLWALVVLAAIDGTKFVSPSVDHQVSAAQGERIAQHDVGLIGALVFRELLFADPARPLSDKREIPVDGPGPLKPRCYTGAAQWTC
jgi:hypothetical protein